MYTNRDTVYLACIQNYMIVQGRFCKHRGRVKVVLPMYSSRDCPTTNLTGHFVNQRK